MNSFTVYLKHGSTMWQQYESGLQLMPQQTSECFWEFRLGQRLWMWQLYRFGNDSVWHDKTNSFIVWLSAWERELCESKSSHQRPMGTQGSDGKGEYNKHREKQEKQQAA